MGGCKETLVDASKLLRGSYTGKYYNVQYLADYGNRILMPYTVVRADNYMQTSPNYNSLGTIPFRLICNHHHSRSHVKPIEAIPLRGYTISPNTGDVSTLVAI